MLSEEEKLKLSNGDMVEVSSDEEGFKDAKLCGHVEFIDNKLVEASKVCTLLLFFHFTGIGSVFNECQDFFPSLSPQMDKVLLSLLFSSVF